MSNLISYYRGNLFDSHAEVLAHGVNAKGIMGAGIALEFKNRFPANFRIYKSYCDTWNKADPSRSLGGSILPYVPANNDPIIVNMFTQIEPGKHAKIEFIHSAMLATILMMSSSEPRFTTLAIPRIGCGIGGLRWGDVDKLLHSILDKYPMIALEVWSR